MFEVLTWAQLGLHRKPCGLLNTAGYSDGLLAFIQTSANAPDVECTGSLQQAANHIRKFARMLPSDGRSRLVKPGDRKPRYERFRSDTLFACLVLQPRVFWKTSL